eukprot:jgi/Mesvir1/738/Mv17342-RA.1
MSKARGLWKMLEGVTSMEPVTNKGRAQREIDVRKLYQCLLAQRTQVNGRSEGAAAGAAIDPAEPGIEEQERVVTHSITSQFLTVARILHARHMNSSLAEAYARIEQPASAATQPAGPSGGLAYAVSDHNCAKTAAAASRTAQEEVVAGLLERMRADGTDQAGASLSRAELGRCVRSVLGFSLSVGPSRVEHPEAGQGLFLEGRVPQGTLVALYPGVVYSRHEHKRMKDYPKVDRHNDYLFSRFDTHIADGLSWGLDPLQGGHAGPSEHRTWGYAEDQCAQESELWRSSSSRGSARGREARLRGAPVGALEWCHPLALGHLANHPGKGMLPNVMPFGFDFAVDRSGDPQPETITRVDPHRGWWQRQVAPSEADAPIGASLDPALYRYRRYLPNVMQPELAVGRFDPRVPVRALALVSTREVTDEELLLNYRFSRQFYQPGWYHPVDQGEDDRRWE